MTVMLTPCHAKDIPSFRLLRESVAAVGVPLDHVAVVHDEDLAEFAAVVGDQRDLEIVPSSKVLGADLDRRRRRGRQRWRRAVPAALGGGVGGWWTQQVVKLAVGETLGLDEWVCVDSDAAFVRPLHAADFHDTDGRLHLQEHVGLGVGASVRAFHRASAELLRLDVTQLDPRLTYVSVPLPMAGAVVADLLAWLEREYGRPWREVFLRSGATEYPLYGFFARHVDGLARVVPVDRRWTRQVWTDDLEVVRGSLKEAREDPETRMVMVHGGLHVPPSAYRDLVLGPQ
jgi:hypothetical protein